MRTLITLLFCLILSGCFGTFGKTPEPEIKYVYKNVLIVPPENLIQDCPLQEPPNNEDYLAADWPGKENLLIKAYSASIEKTILCNVNSQKLRDWKQQQQKVYANE